METHEIRILAKCLYSFKFAICGLRLFFVLSDGGKPKPITG